MQLVSESVKAKQLHSALLSEKQALADQLKQINSLIENSKKKIASSVEQVMFPLLHSSPTCIFYFDISLNNFTVVNNYLNPTDTMSSIRSRQMYSRGKTHCSGFRVCQEGIG